MGKKTGLPEARAMTMSEIRELRKAGFDPAFSESEDAAGKKMCEMVDWIADNIYSDYDLDAIPYPEIVKLGVATYNLTYGRETEIKNFSTSGTGRQEEQNTAETA